MALIRRSPYHHQFVKQGAQFVDRIGFAAPYVFTTIEEEHRAARERVGLFDVYYQVAIEVAGRDAAAVLALALVADTVAQPIGKVVYAAPCNDQGGMIDDLTCFRTAPDRFLLYPTPSRVAPVMAAVQQAVGALEAMVTNLGYKRAYVSVQGPASRALLQGLTSADLSHETLAYFSFIEATLADVPEVIISRTGYSGELGFELFYPSEYAEHMLDTLLEAGAALGVQLCGLGALRSLRIEKRYPLYGLDLDETTTPIEAGLGWTVKLAKPAFRGRAVLEAQKAAGPPRRLVLLQLAVGAAQPAAGTAITAGDKAVGKVTSSDMGHSLGAMLAMGYVAPEAAVNGGLLQIAGTEATVFTRAPYDPDGSRARS
jgi:aminomethyltransferase